MDANTLETVWGFTVLQLRAHALAYGLTGPMELGAMVERVASAIDADSARMVPRQRRNVVEVRRA